MITKTLTMLTEILNIMTNILIPLTEVLFRLTKILCYKQMMITNLYYKNLGTSLTAVAIALDQVIPEHYRTACIMYTTILTDAGRSGMKPETLRFPGPGITTVSTVSHISNETFLQYQREVNCAIKNVSYQGEINCVFSYKHILVSSI